MAKSGPQKYPGASTAHWYQGTYGGDAMETNVIVWHSTEGTSLPTYSGGAVAPNLTVVPDFKAKKLLWYQHFDFDVSARALVHAGAVATNTLNVAQVEVVGTCDPATHAKWKKAGYAHLYMEDLPDWVIRDLSAFARWAHDQHGVPLSSGLAFKAYPGSYGTSNGVRMSDKQWLAFKGHCGHQHVPSGNVHGDPGDFPMTAILNEAKSDSGGSSSGGSTSSNGSSAAPRVSLAHVVAAARRDPSAAQGHTTYKADVLIVERALEAEGLLAKGYVDGSFGSKSVTAYSALQRRYGYRGADANGIPGRASLTRLGEAHGFTVIS